MKIGIIGTRGIPANYGGFETFAEEVATRLVECGTEVLVVGDKGHQYDLISYKGVEVRKTLASKPTNPLKFYKESLELAIEYGAEFILMCGVGGTMLIPFYKNKKTVIAVNPDGLGFKRNKYGWWKKMAFYSQYLVSAKLSEYLICDSKGISTYYKKQFGRNKNLSIIEYGTYINPFLDKKISREEFIKHELLYIPFQYHLIVSRLEPENNVEMILKGFSQAERNFPLVVVGNTNTRHSAELLAYKSKNIHFIGGVYDREKLQLLRAGSFSYWHGHSVGGTNPSLLEAMGSGNLCICHDNVFNREVVREYGFYFANMNNASDLFTEIEKDQLDRESFVSGVLKRAKNYYNWDLISGKYLNFALEAIENKR
ncbi:MAG TPA: DUF1972 domain-containing protein [Aequorivita sp.]|nr:DUF1972 domain-containing protein [Aequorivita sp.]